MVVGGTHGQESGGGGRNGGRLGSWPHVRHVRAVATESAVLAGGGGGAGVHGAGVYSGWWRWAGSAPANGWLLTAFEVLRVHGLERGETGSPGGGRRGHFEAGDKALAKGPLRKHGEGGDGQRQRHGEAITTPRLASFLLFSESRDRGTTQ